MNEDKQKAGIREEQMEDNDEAPRPPQDPPQDAAAEEGQQVITCSVGITLRRQGASNG